MSGSLPVPMRVMQVELSRPLPVLRAGFSDRGAHYRGARVLVRLHSYPVGVLDVDLTGGELAARDLAALIEQELGDAVSAHLNRDGVTTTRVGPRGLAQGLEHQCVKARAALLADAPQATVIIPTRGRPRLVQKALRAVSASTYPAEQMRLIVVDNVPPDRLTEQLVRRAARADHRISYLRCDTPGSASARNAGIDAADTELVALLDDDVTVDPLWLAEMMVALSSNLAVACVTGAILPLQLETKAQMLMEQYGGYFKGCEPRTWSVDSPPPDEPLFPYTCGRFGSGNSVAFRRSVIRMVGGYDPALGNGTPACAGEDLEVFLRILRKGYALRYEPHALAWHLHRREMADLRSLLTDYGRGVSAALTSTVIRDPGAAREIASRLPGGLRYPISPTSPKNAHHAGSYPVSLRLREIYGLARGPSGYLQSRRVATGSSRL